MKILLLSFTDSSNFGDQLIVEQLKKRLQNYGDVITYSYSFKKNIEYLTLKTPPTSKEKLNKIKQIYSDYFRKNILFDKLHGFNMVHNQKKRINKSEFLYDLQKSDLLVIGGGNTIFDLTKHSRSADKYEVIVSQAIKEKKIIYFMDIGIGPFCTEKQLIKTRQLLSKADFVTVRDEASQSLLDELPNVQLSIDPVFSYENSMVTKISNNKIGFSVIDLRLNKSSKTEYEKYLLATKKLILKILNFYPDQEIVLFNSEVRDYVAVNDLITLLKNTNRIESVFIGSKSDLIELYKNLKLIVGTRMHSMILAISQGIPIVGLSWQAKVTEMFKIMSDEKSVFPITEIEENIDRIFAQINEKILSPNCFMSHNFEKVKKLENINIINLEEIKASLKNE